MEPEKRLRKASTDAEQRVWSRLRSSQLGYKFRRQHELVGYIVDFVCVERGLIVELDGSQHLDQTNYDETRTAGLEALGFRVIRFWNNDVLLDTENVLAAIAAALADTPPPHPNPLPRQRRGRGSRTASTSPVERQVAIDDHGYSSQTASDRRHSALKVRAQLYTLIRSFFAERNVLEVETPILSAAANTDPNIQSFATAFSGHVDSGSRRRWLRTSSEFAQKRLLAAGVGDNYELGRVFRDGEAGRRHNPEFSMLEWYRVGWDHRRMADEAVALVQASLALVGRNAEVYKTGYRRLFIDTLAVDPFTAKQDELRGALGSVQIHDDGLSRDDWLDLLLTHRIQPAFPRGRISVIEDYPASQCALSKIRAGDPPVAERFELYLGVHELANGYHELTDAAEQRARFERDNVRRRERGVGELPIDANLLAALEHGMPECAGVALGIERLLMGMLGSDDIRDVLAFAFREA